MKHLVEVVLVHCPSTDGVKQLRSNVRGVLRIVDQGVQVGDKSSEAVLPAGRADVGPDILDARLGHRGRHRVPKDIFDVAEDRCVVVTGERSSLALAFAHAHLQEHAADGTIDAFVFAFVFVFIFVLREELKPLAMRFPARRAEHVATEKGDTGLGVELVDLGGVEAKDVKLGLKTDRTHHMSGWLVLVRVEDVLHDLVPEGNSNNRGGHDVGWCLCG